MQILFSNKSSVSQFFRLSALQSNNNSLNAPIVPTYIKCERKSFHQKRRFLYRIFIELQKLTGNRGILQLNNKAQNQNCTSYLNVDEFFEQILSSTFQKYIVDTVIELSKKIKYKTSITDEDKQEFIKGLKCQDTQRKDSLCKQKKKKAQEKLFGVLQQQGEDENQNISNNIENQIQEIINNILENLKEIFLKEL